MTSRVGGLLTYDTLRSSIPAELTMPRDTQNIARLRSYLNLKARVHASDGRVFLGTFVCTDKERNVILAHTEEFSGQEKRQVGLVMIPGKHLVKIEIEDLETSDEYT
ncbi:hypothetical protein BC938DRAFT_479309 [Jimgerdemannia flammicorona]|nr:hypothetical protein BC938DRAFT_479309 [Jimgerdemannia flammicorona]